MTDETYLKWANSLIEHISKGRYIPYFQSRSEEIAKSLAEKLKEDLEEFVVSDWFCDGCDPTWFCDNCERPSGPRGYNEGYL